MDWTTRPWESFSRDSHSQEPGHALTNLTELNSRLASLCNKACGYIAVASETVGKCLKDSNSTEVTTKPLQQNGNVS